MKQLECSSILETLGFRASDHLHELISDNNALLNLAKAWHVCDLLEMPGLQNKLLGTYRGHYLRCLKNHIRLPLDPEPFAYLRDNIGNHTKAERFIVDFHAGLMQTESRFEPMIFSSLPNDIVINIKDRWQQLSGKVRKDSFLPELGNDRIADGISNYKVGKNDNTRHSVMQVQHRCATPDSRWYNLKLPLHARHNTISNPSIPLTLGSNSCSTPRCRTREDHPTTFCACVKTGIEASGHYTLQGRTTLEAKPILTNPFVKSTSRRRPTVSQPVSPTEAPSMQQLFSHDYRQSTATIEGSQALQTQDSHQSRASPVWAGPSRAPFMPSSPARTRRSRNIDDSDEESVYDLFFSDSISDSPWLDADDERSCRLRSQQVKPILGILDFAA
ncbi:hypothetical protein ST47_g4954 [Ascochyta rabiei]|uniref:Uncharacterized protein n=1 Tax=Didymella rabiei TaxID=5454 RepID=A0A163EU72_DIDRA|nr:hypothetical protein ST47_g4954 [Ascochyta rabiei]